MDTNTFCKHLSNGYRININGDNITYAPCCYWQGPQMPFERLTETRKFLNNSTPWIHKECGRCKEEEKYKEQNYRFQGNNTIRDNLPSSKVGWLDIQADITCNGGCLICGPWNSSYWQNELVKFKELPKLSKKVDLKNLVDNIFQSIDVSELNLLQFLGGEPFLSDVDTWAFPYITNPSACTLKYTTNGSIEPSEEKMNKWTEFKTVMINYSIDAVEDQFEYLRYPLKWKVVEQNIKSMLDKNYSNMVFHINCTITPLNILYYDKFLKWVDEIFPSDRFTGIHAHTAYGIMSVSNSSQRLRDMVENKYGTNHFLTKMLKSNPILDEQKFSNYINTWDTRRGLNWRDVFPEISECY